MNFQKYCDLISDDQKVKAEKTLLLTYTNSKGEAFSISPESIKSFLCFLLDNYEAVHSVWAKVPTRKEYIYQYEEKSYREIYKSATDDGIKIISSAGRSQTKALTKLIAKLIGFLTSIPYQSPEVNTFFEEKHLRLALDKWSDFVGRESSNKEKLSAVNIKEQFRSWMINKGLSARTASSYSGAGVTYCDKYINDINANVSSFYQLNSEQVLNALKELGKVGEWLQADKSGNSMYSAACKKLAEFLAEKSYISYTSLSKSFLLLAGVSGTGKTRFVREQAKTSGQFAETYCLTSVRPDWHEPSDLLGYISRLNGTAEYITTDVLQFIAKAWRAIADTKSADSGLNVEVQNIEDLGERLVITGERDALEQVSPYWLCLDEMNLAPVEQYFADYLSVLETREWRWTGDSFTYNSDALLNPATIKEVADIGKLREALGFNSEEYNELWGLICQYGLGIPFNLMVAGTVNMDETTHGFSRKVIDRALSFDFGVFFPNHYDDFFTPTSCNKRLSYPIWSNASKADLANTFDVDGTKTVAFLSAINTVLKSTPFELAFRALNELLLAVASSQPQDDLTLKAVWDDFMMCKVLPRIEGDADKLTTSDGKALLPELSSVLANQLDPIWLAPATDEANQRPDLYREKIVADGANDEEKVLLIPCRSKAKLKWMSDRLASATFTSFWP
ncbi:hypothetical protein NO559_13395 [Dasania sp. GY-MA-18]|uniref:Restriction endonuclease n=1 Tax=Dasania phycosphaerae TaxID=2950436 RepID=A0A9J6RNW9_9GAMM|nr:MULTISPECIES: hypothetical protein [Dasania]MCR8923770.1 hypothetical protein [Dasania sp. GY-MA-18]MCZ0866204.1 hypothetical protein [Dasania phycosphaerae]MCZ0869928.1 hypothetical protein [Dasania phycosphaerae]